MDKKLTTKQIQDSFDNHDFPPDLDYVIPNNENLSYDPDILPKLGLDLNSNLELIQTTLDSGKTFILPKDKVDRDILDLEYYSRNSTICFYILYNQIHDKYYIGQTTNLDRRMFDHLRNLEKGIHNNSELQVDFDKIKNRGLNPYISFKVSTIQNQSIIRSYNQDEKYALALQLKHIEGVLIKLYRKAGCTLYNNTGFLEGKSKKLKNAQIRNQEPEEFYSLSRELTERGLVNCSLSPSSSPVPVIINEIEYESISVAAEELNMNRRHVFFCILSKRFPNFMTKEQSKTGNLYVYFKKQNRRVKFKNTVTGKERLFSNASQCNDYLTNLKKIVDSETTSKYIEAEIFVDRKTIYRKLDKRNDPIFSYYTEKDKPEKVLVLFD